MVNYFDEPLNVSIISQAKCQHLAASNCLDLLLFLSVMIVNKEPSVLNSFLGEKRSNFKIDTFGLGKL